MKSSVLVVIPLILIAHLVKAQEEHKFEYGNVTAADFNPGIKNYDTGANAIIVADIEKVHFEKNEAGDFDVIQTRFMRVKIVNDNGFEAGKFTIYLNKFVPFRSFMMTLPEPGLINLKGITYNLDDGEIRRTGLEMNSVFTTDEGKIMAVEKFAMPGLKAGSLFDVEYSIRSAFRTQDINWSFQRKYPCLWSEYDLALPDAYKYAIKYHGDSNYYIHTVDTATLKSNAYSSTERILVSHFRWVKMNEPPIISESYMSSINNYVDRVSFQYDWGNYFRFKNSFYTLTNWQGFSHMYFAINGLDDFAIEKNNWLNKDLKEVTTGLQSKNEIAAAIYRYVRNHFSCVHINSYFTTRSLRETFKEKAGNVADLNILLAAMLRQEKIEADPALLSTTDNGFGTLTMPQPEEYNYMICVARLDGKNILLDASIPLNPFGNLSPNCYNGGAIVLNSDSPRFILLHPDSVTESNRTNVIITTDEKGSLNGSMSMNCGPQKSYTIREEIKKTSVKEYFHNELAIPAPEIKETSNEEIDELENPDKPLVVQCDLDFKDSARSDVFYFDPVLFPFFKTNPFNSAQRKYLVELPYRIDDVYLAAIDIPKGYTVESLPVSESFSLNTTDGSFDYILDKNDESIQLKVRMKLNKTIFSLEEYSALRTFFNISLKKENEKIVFRKIN